MRYYLLTLGCQMNLSDSERIHTVLKEMGLEQSPQPQASPWKEKCRP
jgi:tRNA A37 methylthiotransferase MiaB